MVRQEGRTISKAVYNILGINRHGHKELLDVCVSECEGATFWLPVLTDLQQQGVEDMLLACVDNLKGFAEAISSIFPQANVQSCIAHQFRDSLRYVMPLSNWSQTAQQWPSGSGSACNWT